MTATTQDAKAPINDLPSAKEDKNRARRPENRRRLRRFDLKTMNGLLRANATIIRQIMAGEGNVPRLDAASRSIRRQAEIMGTIQDQQDRQDLIARLEALERRAPLDVSQVRDMLAAPGQPDTEKGEAA